MKKVVLGAVIATAAMFTGCKLSAADDYTSCDIKNKILISTHMCIETTTHGDELAEYCAAKYKSGINAGTYSSACQGGAKKTCKGKKGTYYYYDDLNALGSCDNLSEF